MSAAGGGDRPRIALLAFSPVARDARVLRQARYLGERFDVTAIAYGPLDGPLPAGARFVPLVPPIVPAVRERLATLAGLVAARVHLADYERLFWRYPLYRAAHDALRAADADVLLANDWPALPVACRVARESGTPVVLDLHEYAPRQWDNVWHWRLLRGPMIDRLLRRHIACAAATLTVTDALAEAYASEYGFRPTVLLNAPESVPLPSARPCDPHAVRIVHHGVAGRARRLDGMVRAVALAGDRFALDLYLVAGDPGYASELAELAGRLAPGRVRVLPPVAPSDIVPTLAGYDVGLFVLPPTTFNYRHALPNKLFDFIAAGLAVVVGPSPEMARIVGAHDCGVVAPSFEPADVALVLRALDPVRIDRLKASSRRAARVLNADVEGAKLQAIVAGILVPGDPGAPGRPSPR